MITTRDAHYIQLARQIARLSLCRFKIGAVIVRRGKPVSLACNVLKSHPKHRDYPPNVISIHAEHRAVLLAQTDIAGATMYIARQGGNNISMPCETCRAYLVEAGIRTIVYTNGKELIKEYLS